MSLQVKNVVDRLTNRVVANIAKTKGANKLQEKKAASVHS